jgi:hypothetical protein
MNGYGEEKKESFTMKNVKINIFFFFYIMVSLFCFADEERDFGFFCREIYTFHSSTDQLTIIDMNNDGCDDILFVDNSVSRIELLLRKKDAPASKVQKTIDESFENRGFVIDQIVKQMVCTDLDGDKRNDIISIGKPFGLFISYQEKDGTFGTPVIPYLGRNIDFIGLEVVDANHDTKQDIIVARKNNIEILWNEEKEAFKKRKVVPFFRGSCTYVTTGEFTGDMYPDLLLAFSGTELPVKVRPGTKDGTFGWEIPLDPGSCYYIDKVNSDTQHHHDIGILLKNNMVFRLYYLKEEVVTHFFDQEEMVPKNLPFHGRISHETSWVLTDINTDSYPDMCVSMPEYSQLHIYYGNDQGFKEEPLIVDSLSEVEKLLIDGNGNIIAFSREEDKLACHLKRKIIEFPRVLEIPSTQEAVAAYKGIIYSLAKKQRGSDYTLFTLSWGIDGSMKTNKRYTVTLSATPYDMLLYTVDALTTGIIFFMPYNSPEIFHLKGDVLQHIISTELKNLPKKTAPSQILPLYDHTGCKLIICEDRIAREYTWNGSSYTITRQFNPSSDTAHLVSVCKYPGKNKRPGYLFFERSAHILYWFSENNINEKPLVFHIKSDINNLYGFTSFSGPGIQGLLLIDRNGMHLLTDKTKNRVLSLKAEYSSQADKPFLWNFSSILVGKKAKKMIALFDKNNRSLEIVEKTKNRLEKRLAFEVFQVSQMLESSAVSSFEPHDIASGDINGDRIMDLAVLVHDKLIIYFGE